MSKSHKEIYKHQKRYLSKAQRTEYTKNRDQKKKLFPERKQKKKALQKMKEEWKPVPTGVTL